MKPIFERLIEHFGTQQAAADALGVDQSTVSGWLRGKFGMSPSIALRAERATDGKFSRQELCPNFPWQDIHAA